MRRAPCRFNGSLKLCKGSASIVEKIRARVGQFHAASLATKQLHVKLSFDRLDLLAQRRLLHSETLGSPGDVAFLGDSDEVTQVP